MKDQRVILGEEVENDQREIILGKIAKENREKISGAVVFMELFNEKIAEEPIPMMQLGMAVMLDKPILLLVPRGAKIPRNLVVMAKAIEYFDPGGNGSLKAAVEKLLKEVE